MALENDINCEFVINGLYFVEIRSLYTYAD